MKITATLLFSAFSVVMLAQEKIKDSILPMTLNEIVVIGKKSALSQKLPKSLATIEDYLQQSSKINMVKRGAYAWEPLINSMASERTVITIDGMRIFGACTDKMDPVTSYVEVSNLAEANITSGQQGSCHGPTIGGALDLKRNSPALQKMGWSGHLNMGYETVNNHKIIGGAAGYSDSLFYAHADVMFRDAGNYDAGNNIEVPFSQFTKYNMSVTTGFRPGERKLIEAAVIFDKATDIGYPALPMDVSLAQATIASLRYLYRLKSGIFSDWETKVYANSIRHKMDDSKRPSVPIRMDMPGWSDTYGYFSTLKGRRKSHEFSASLNAFYNKSLAQMTMYPENRDEKLMFMFTWPDVRSFYNGLFLEDRITLSANTAVKIGASIGNHSNKVADASGLQSLRIFYPEMSATKNRILKSLAANYIWDKSQWTIDFGLAYGERAPSVSEGYGFYLYNSNDFYDYIGNPGLKTEQSLEGNFSLAYKNDRFSTKLGSSYFHIRNYIIGTVSTNVLPMTIGASGVKTYQSFDYATVFNTDLNAEYKLPDHWNFKAQLAYSRGQDSDGNNLPFISPLRYSGAIQYKTGFLNLGLNASGNLAQQQFAAVYGETKTAAYVIFGLNAGYAIKWNRMQTQLQTGIENIFDAHYTTFSDWSGISRPGLNFFINLTHELF